MSAGQSRRGVAHEANRKDEDAGLQQHGAERHRGARRHRRRNDHRDEPVGESHHHHDGPADRRQVGVGEGGRHRRPGEPAEYPVEPEHDAENAGAEHVREGQRHVQLHGPRHGAAAIPVHARIATRSTAAMTSPADHAMPLYSPIQKCDTMPATPPA